MSFIYLSKINAFNFTLLSHQTETTHWDHPEMVSTFKSLMAFNTIRFSAYRTAMKIRELQKKLSRESIHFVDLSSSRQKYSPDSNKWGVSCQRKLWALLPNLIFRSIDPRSPQSRQTCSGVFGKCFARVSLYKITFSSRYLGDLSTYSIIRFLFSSPLVSQRRDRGFWRSRSPGSERADAGRGGHRDHPWQPLRDNLGEFPNKGLIMIISVPL